ncbi:MAG: SUMF1/EgtB/PvdO family nonheme iron enzyme [Spirochaetota bacterium]
MGIRGEIVYDNFARGWYGSYTASSQTDTRGPCSGSDCVLRGGNWHNNDSDMRAASRYDYDPHGRSTAGGFRVARSAR